MVSELLIREIAYLVFPIFKFCFGKMIRITMKYEDVCPPLISLLLVVQFVKDYICQGIGKQKCLPSEWLCGHEDWKVIVIEKCLR